MKKVIKYIMILILIISMIFTTTSNAFDLNTDIPIVDKSQTIQCMKDRHASKEFLNSIDFVYKYALEVGIDPSIVMAMSALETGYGKSNLFKSNNNPGGIKAKRGWAKFNSLEDGYTYMINLLATYSGLKNTSSWLHGKALTTEQLGKIYWVENGVDKGYHNQLTIMIKAMGSYPVVKENVKKESSIDKIKDAIHKKNSPMDVIQKILSRKKDSNSLEFIMERLNK